VGEITSHEVWDFPKGGERIMNETYKFGMEPDSFIKFGWASDLLLTNKKLTKVNRELKSIHRRLGIPPRAGKNNE